MEADALGAQGEAAWARLVRRIGQLQGFGYVVLFVPDPAVLPPFKARLAAWMAGRGWPWIQLSEARPAGFAGRSITGLFDGLAASPQPRLVWLEAHRGAGQPAWERARGELLSRLNERRGRLESELVGTLVLVLPEGSQRSAAGLAPDLWHVRSLGLSLAGVPVLAHEGQVLPGTPGEPVGPPQASSSLLPELAADVAQAGAGPGMAAEDLPDAAAEAWLQRWRGLLAGRPIEQLALDDEALLTFNVSDGLACQSALLRQGRVAEAQQLGDQWVRLARRRRAQGMGLLDIGTGRELCAALGGQAAALMQLDRPQEALALCEERVAVSRELALRLGETAAALRETAVALDQLSRVAQILGDWSRAAAAAEESLALHRKLAGRLGETPDSLRGLAQALDHAGHAAQALGDWYRAGAAYEESLSLRQALLSRLGETPEALRDLSTALDNIGRVAEAQGDWARGAEACEEALTLRRTLVERQGSMPERLAQSRIRLAQGGAGPELEADLASTLLDAAALPGPKAEAYRLEAGRILASLRQRFPDVHRYERLQQRWALSHASAPAPTAPADVPPHQPQAGSSST
ncbi:tetratricopeptide repeat protein [Roseateles sp. DB2]|uniref:tetratricopeptide repeat protein n=1 Tax=Roseateles sp. DB2 TaxID=3453717 RepID=UPI003EE99B18